MSITDELRKYAQGWRENPNLMDDLDAGDIDGLLGDFEHIADRIDAEHERVRDGVYADKMDASGWIRMPKDADGEYIHIGDVMEWPTTGETFEVVGIGEGTLFYVDDGSEYADWTGASTKRHHHAPTVEDVLREFGRGWHEQMNGPETFDVADYVERYAAKLRLAESEDA